MEMAAGFANEQAAMAAQRAADAETALLKYRAQRGLSDEEQQQVAAALAPYAGTPFDAALTRGDAECNRCSKTIESALRSAGLVQIDWGGQGDAIPTKGARAAVGEVMGIGLFLTVEGETHPELVPIAEAIAAALALAGVEAVAFAKVNNSNANTHAIHLHVCQKP
jgi:hypothetical protein